MKEGLRKRKKREKKSYAIKVTKPRNKSSWNQAGKSREQEAGKRQVGSWKREAGTESARARERERKQGSQGECGESSMVRESMVMVGGIDDQGGKQIDEMAGWLEDRMVR